MASRTLILSGYGLNCERETRHCCELAGGTQVDVVHWVSFLRGDIRLRSYQFLVLIGGFLDGDDLGAGRVGANRIRTHRFLTEIPSLQEQFLEFIETGSLILGICNGFQLMVKLGILPATSHPMGPQEVTLTANQQNRFENRWVHLVPDPQSSCIFTKNIESLYLPVRHGEGRVVGDSALLEQLEQRHQIPLRYATSDGVMTETYPHNPNGSPLGIAAFSNESGNLMGMMPHPEGFYHYTQHPSWTRHPELPEEGAGLCLFRNAYQYLDH